MSTATRWRDATGAAALLLVIGATIAARVVAMRAHVPMRDVDPLSMIGNAVGYVTPIAFMTPGVVLLLRRRWHPVGWLLCMLACSEAASFSSSWELVARSGGPWLFWLLNTLGDWSFLSWLVALLVVFPDGIADRGGWRRGTDLLVLGVASLGVAAAAFATHTRSEDGVLIANPSGVGFVPRGAVDAIGMAVLLALVVALARLVARYRTATSVSKLQHRWVLAAFGAAIGALLIGLTAVYVFGRSSFVWFVPFVVAQLTVPMAFMAAILRYRLYDIDRIISRSVTYGIVVLLLGGVYAGAVTTLTQTVQLPNELAVAATTLAVAGLFSPLVRRIRRLVDQRFNRVRFAADRELDAFARAVREQPALSQIRTELTTVVERTLQPTALTVWLADAPVGDPVPSRGRPVS